MRGGKFLVAAAAVLLASCKVGPNYKRPQIEPPALHRSDPAPDASPSAARIFADVKWFELFQDEQLQNIIRTGLERNYDVLIAAQRVLEARERYTISRSRLYPTIDGNASIDSTRLSTSALTDVPPGTTLHRESGSLGLSMFW